MAIRLLASDLDGTFLDHSGKVSAANLQALQAAQAAGVQVVFVTGRPPRWLPAVIEQTNFDGYIIAANGGMIIDASTGIIVETFPIATSTARVGISRMLAAMPDLEFGVERADVGMRIPPIGDIHLHNDWTIEMSPQSEFAMTPGYHPHGSTLGPIPTGDIMDLVEGDRVVKIVVRPRDSGALDSDVFLDLVTEALDGVMNATHSSPDDALVEISAAGVSKGATLAVLAAQLGYQADEVAAVGDMPNDVSMLDWAGEPYVMGNAHASLHERFDTVIRPHHEDGVAHLLHDLIRRRQVID